MRNHGNHPSMMSRFERSERLPISWYNKASDLRGAAGLVWSGMHADDQGALANQLGLGAGFSFSAACYPVYFMLCGLALELLLKAGIVSLGRRPKLKHRLNELWDELGLPKTAAEKALLSILSESTYWAGRYPVPKREADFDRFSELVWSHLWDKTTGPAGLDIRHGNDKLDWDSFNDLWSRVHASPAIRSIFG